MQALLAIALKSLLISGLALGLLALLKRRSPAERSWVAHIGLLALVALAFAPLVLPSLPVEAPALFAKADTPPERLTAVPATTAPAIASRGAAVPATESRPAISSAAIAMAVYAIPATILLLVTLLALGRLLALRARAEVLVDGHWLSALARAQRRMGFKHGTALLTSKDKDLASPISWGLMRPVILLNERAVESSGEAEAIIAHELAHVARLDWAKLLLARIATALFWFNPLVWLLAREAHQLREETADDAVLESDIADTDYAELLVGVARHECSGLLLGAHGVAPSRGSLARRVARVLDSASVRGPVALPFALGVFVGAVVIAAPLAALTLTPSNTTESRNTHPVAKVAGTGLDTSIPYYAGREAPADLPHIIAQGVSTSVEGAVAAIHPDVVLHTNGPDFETTSPSGASVRSVGGMTVARSPSGALLTVYPPDGQGRRKLVAVAASGARTVTYVGDDFQMAGGPSIHHGRRGDPLETAIAMKAAGVTPEYIRSMVAAAPELRGIDPDDFMGLRALGVMPADIANFRRSGYGNLSADRLMEFKTLGYLDDEASNPPRPPHPPTPPSDDGDDDDDDG